MGYLLPMADAPSGQLGFTDAVLQDDSQFDAAFPYLRTPTRARCDREEANHESPQIHRAGGAADRARRV
jgi:hypothetical protein